MYYALKLYDVDANILTEGIYSTVRNAQDKVQYYIKHHRDKIIFYDIDLIEIDSQLANEDLLKILYSK